MADALSPSSRFAWPVALVGLGLFAFATVGLSGPGRIDIVDGQTRFEVGRSFVEHGDSILRDERVWWSRFPGRDGQPYSYYRFPQSVVAALAILVSDATGPVREGRRHFCYVLGGAVACGLLSIVYALWFRHNGCRPFAAILWGAGGIFCTPIWFYGTSTFDEYLGTTVLLFALVIAALRRSRWSGTILTGLLIGLAFNCKQPLGAFVLLAVALHDNPAESRSRRVGRAGIILLGLLAGVGAEQAYDHYKFPFDKGTAHAEQRAFYGPNFAHHQLEAVVVLTFSLGAGVFWYFPPLLLCLRGIAARWKAERNIVLALLAGAVPFLAFFCSLSYFKGDPCWGPRYLTPLLGVLWLFAPMGAAKLRPWVVGLLLGLGIGVQVLGLSVDPHRLYVQRDASSGFGRIHPWLYLDPDLSHLANRPREIVEIVRETVPAEEFTPAPSPTFAFPLIDPPHLPERGPTVVKHYRILNSFRPWWTSMTFLPLHDRPVNLGKFAALLLAIASAGLLLMGYSARALSPVD